MVASFYVVGMKVRFALIGVEHRSLAVEVVDSELEIAGRFGSGTVFAEKQVVAAGFAWTFFNLPYVPFGCLEVAGEGLEAPMA